MMPFDWLQLSAIVTNITVIIVGVKLVRYLSRMELKIDTLWDIFMNEKLVKTTRGIPK